MNQQIRLLSDEAHEFALNTIEYGENFGDIWIEKFAELLIKECLDQCYNKGMNDSLYEGQLKAASYIEQHFGINNE